MLKLSEQASLETLKEKVHHVFEHDASGHGIDHIERVVANATLLLSDVPQANPFITLCIVYLHDVYDHKINPVDNVELALLEFMAASEIDFFGWEAQIAKGASQIGFSIRHSVIDQSIESYLVSEADYLDAMGPMGMIRTIQYGILNNHSVDVMVNHIPEKLLLLNDLLRSPKAKQLGQERHEFLQTFYDLYQKSK